MHAENLGKSEQAATLGDLGGQVRRAIFWRTGSQVVAQTISWSATLIVIRLLNPADYGLFAMAQVMMTFMDFLNGYGFASSLIQSKEVSRQAIRQALGLMMVMNLSIAALQYALAPTVAAYYGKPVVADLLHTLAFIYLATPFIIVPEVILSRGLDFRKQALVNLIAAVVGASVSLGCAFSGFGVWTLVYAPVALFFARAIGLTIAARLFVLPSFNFRGAGRILRFGGALMASHLFWVIQSQSDIFIAGRRFDAHAVGLYSEALFLTALVMTKFVPPLNQIAFPAYARLQDDRVAIRWSFLGSIRLIMLATAPIFFGIAASAGPLVDVIFGHKWIAMAPLMQIIGVTMPFMTVQILFAPVSNALGRPDVSMRVSACGAVIFGTSFLIGAQFGIHGLALAWLAAAPGLLILTIILAGRVSGVSFADVTAAAAPAIGCGLAMGSTVWMLDHLFSMALEPLPHLALLILTGVGVYALLAWQFQRSTVTRLIGLVTRRPSAQEPAI